MKTKAQKTKEMDSSKELLAKSQSLIFADFTGVSFEQLKKLKNELKKTGAVFKVIKKRLLGIVFKQTGLDFNPKQFKAQLGVIFVPGDVSQTAGAVYKFSRGLVKEKKEFKMLGAFEIPKKNFLDAEQFLMIAKLPSREILLAQLVGILSGPIRALMYVLQERAKKVAT